MTNIDSSIFKAYDIRGLYPEQLNEDGAYAIARAYATLMVKENPGKQLTIAVGADMRTSSPSLKERVIQALVDSGLNVADIGLVSTPTFYFGVAFYGYDGGIQVSASHNPKQYNGLKLTRKNAVPISGDTGIQDLYQMVREESYAPIAERKGQVETRGHVVEDEAADQSKGIDISKIKPLKIVVDACNAMGGVDIEAMFAGLPVTLVKMNFGLDGTFPVHEADPMKDENTEDLRLRVVEERADLGIAPDGDGDRYFFVDEKGEMVPQPILRGLMAQIELRDHPGATVAYDIRPGKITADMIEQLGGKPVVTRVGHSLIKEAMIKTGAIFGGESSGHYFYKMPYGVFEMPIILTLKLLKYVSEQDKPFSEVLEPFKKYFNTGEINTKLENRDVAHAKIEVIKEKYADGEINLLDGISVEYPDYWFSVRASNTEPVLRLIVEARTPELMAAKRDELLGLIRA
jgi:phosphomannomutase